MKHFINTYGFSVLRWTIAILCFAFLGHRLYYSYREFISSFAVMFSSGNLLLFAVLVLLMFINWGTESLKWMLGAGVISAISYTRAFLSVLAGLAVSMAGPNRTGEFIGRITVLPKEKRTAGAFVSIQISLAQTIVTIMAGLAAWLLTDSQHLPFRTSPGAITLVLFLVLVISLVAYFRFAWLYKVLQGRPFARWFRNAELQTIRVKNSLLIYNLILSVLRYAVFITQFVIAFRIFGLPLSVSELYLSSAVIYLLMAAVPSFALAELGVRGTLSVFVMGLYSADSGPVIAASTLIWILNIAIPASAGAVILAARK
jgi:hypothetical protein